MPKLKAALQSHHFSAQRAASAKRAKAAEEAKRASVKASLSGSKKGRKRANGNANANGNGGQATQTENRTLDGRASKTGGGGAAPGDTPAAQAAQAGKAGSSTRPPAHGQRDRPTIPFDSTDSILLLGEGNFSFALSLLSLSLTSSQSSSSSSQRRIRGTQILATAYDDEKTTYTKYPDARANVDKLRGAGARVEFGVDAGALERCKAVGKGRWSRVVFNFPHVGAGITDQDRNILTNQHMLLRFFRSAARVLTQGPSRFPISASTTKGSKSGKRKGKGKGRAGSDDEDEDEDDLVGGFEELPMDEQVADEGEGEGEEGYLPKASNSTQEFTPPTKEGTILLTLLNQPPYTLWQVPKLAARPPPSIFPSTEQRGKGKSASANVPPSKYRLLRSFDFHPELYEGYAHRRTLGYKEGVSKGRNEEIVGRKGRARTWEFALVPADE